jgi:hypothetical protein
VTGTTEEGFVGEGGDQDADVVAVRQGLGEVRFLTAWTAGRGMDTDEAARYATEGA